MIGVLVNISAGQCCETIISLSWNVHDFCLYPLMVMQLLAMTELNFLITDKCGLLWCLADFYSIYKPCCCCCSNTLCKLSDFTSECSSLFITASVGLFARFCSNLPFPFLFFSPHFCFLLYFSLFVTTPFVFFFFFSKSACLYFCFVFVFYYVHFANFSIVGKQQMLHCIFFLQT